jgi:hypothetical protein
MTNRSLIHRPTIDAKEMIDRACATLVSLSCHLEKRTADPRFEESAVFLIFYWSGRLDSNQRPPAPKIAVLRPSAMLRNDYCSQISDLKRLDARNRRTCSITLRIGTLLEPAEISLSRRKT